MSESDQNNSDFFYRPSVIQWILRIFYGLCVLLVIVDFLVHRHIVTPIEKIPAFYAIYGFIACVILVILAAQLRKWLMRDEGYYSKAESVNNQPNQAKVDHDA